MSKLVNHHSEQEALVRKLVGEEAFEGLSPVDAFCGLEDARY
jgi:beta-N-acetylhexosaminidase